MTNSEGLGPNAYELEREERMARNAAVLAELGLQSTASSLGDIASRAGKHRRPNNAGRSISGKRPKETGSLEVMLNPKLRDKTVTTAQRSSPRSPAAPRYPAASASVK